ncbi:hypothetical protein WMF18_30325 [Sorangium sp. So ce315]|uniref:hypothetical protein n=1 Tax=Sorangium sp. So ce315 TaxID=3133299 RepID=UPI003F5D900D
MRAPSASVSAIPARGASGYHDPVTSAFVGATRLVRHAREIPAACFERRAAGGDASLENGSPDEEPAWCRQCYTAE